MMGDELVDNGSDGDDVGEVDERRSSVVGDVGVCLSYYVDMVRVYST